MAIFREHAFDFNRLLNSVLKHLFDTQISVEKSGKVLMQILRSLRIMSNYVIKSSFTFR